MRLLELIRLAPASTRRGLVAQLLLQGLAGTCGAVAIGTVAAQDSTSGLLILVPIIVAASIAMRIAASAAASRIGMSAAFTLTTVLRRVVLRHVVDVPLDVFSRWSSARLGVVATDQVRKVEIAFSFALAELVSGWTTAAFLFASCWILSWSIGLAALVGLGLYALTSWLSDRLIAHASDALHPATTAAARLIEEHLQGLATVRALGALRRRESRLIDAITELRDILLGASLPLSGAIRAGAAAVDIAVFAGFAFAVSHADGLPATTTAGCAAVLALGANRALTRSASYLAFLRLGSRAAEEIVEFLAEPALSYQMPGAVPERFDIAFEGVDLSYDDRGTQALQGLTFTVPSGRVTAIVGPSGAGKSSILSLVARHRETVAGKVSIGGIDVRRIPADAFARLVTFVEQEPFLFNRSLADNIRLGRTTASLAELDALAVDVGLDDVVAALDRGWDGLVGESGGTLSGGERQRVAIARAALKDAPIALLDEATASLDAEMAATVRDALTRRFAGKTVLIVTHSMTIAAQADHILVIEHGRLVGAGSHDALLATCSVYAGLCAADRRSAEWRLGASVPRYQSWHP